jgi:hypothetical protein
MQAIQVKYLPVTNTKPSRWKAFTKTHSITLAYDHALNSNGNARAAAEALRAKMGWTGNFYGKLVFGVLPNGDYVFTMTGSD